MANFMVVEVLLSLLIILWLSGFSDADDERSNYLPPMIPHPPSTFLVPPLVPSDPPRPVPYRKNVMCRERRFRSCYMLRHTCPSQCPSTCLVDCVACKPVCSCNYPGAVCQDPRFVGGDGITFHFHGHKDEDFCLVSDSNLHINAHFIGKRNPKMKRDFTWVQSIGIIHNNHKLLISANPTSKWYENIDHIHISLNKKSVSLPAKQGSKWHSSAVSIVRSRDTNAITVEMAETFTVNVVAVPITYEESRIHGYNISDENCFAHLELGFKFYNLSEKVDGVLGQTYRKNYVSKAKISSSMAILGGLKRFQSSNIFAIDCQASRFGKFDKEGMDDNGYAKDLNCSSGMKGNGIVCMR